MDKAVASEAIDSILALEQQMCVLDVLSDKIADDEERRAFRQGLAAVIVAYTDLLMSVVAHHPDLDPDKASP